MTTHRTPATTTDCPACKSLASLGMQCNHHRRTAPSAATLRRASIARAVREQGVTVAQAEAAHGVPAGPTVGDIPCTTLPDHNAITEAQVREGRLSVPVGSTAYDPRCPDCVADAAGDEDWS